mmetsp:Transcript_23033/g.54420  ORF Transcript_23033/g.54420 Transcript_23033/m.54420 type:complete len:474 (-) Transcript_23033:226-1647(-)|eukprot:CAMPEP_0197184092 /NCGR_PEP_ID=MMETSP1423-20130617/9154_1 /TAXON_ID=476441 /ORGANISM="Pseudo-nitzschia heimii, Strain UNC1101" /LENGTH=473 /DNA_ID=CAMNT_0042634815 /DNA_START=36 /DNA_END=1457 /DNA_ORIENTATION=+
MSETKPLVASEDDLEMVRRLKAYQPTAFFVTFGGYFMSHFSRKSYSTIKQQIQYDAGFSATILSAMDTVFMFSYAFGNVINGQLGDTFNPTTVLAIGLFGSGFLLLLILGVILSNVIAVSVTTANVALLSILFLFGIFQAAGGPVGTAVMGNWFCDKEAIANRGLIFGFWTCHQYAGDVASALVTAWILGNNWAYWWALFIPAVSNILFGFITMQLVPDPFEAGIITPEVKLRRAKFEAKKKEMAEKGVSIEEDAGPQAISIAGAFQIPMAANYAMVFGFCKLINYCLFFWLPYFLGKTFEPVTANLIASLYSVGLMPGGVIVGYISDLFGGRRALVIGSFMGLLIVFLAIFAKLSGEDEMNPVVLLVMLLCMGILVGGPNNIISSAVAADLASHPSVRGSQKSLGTVTGLINGTGSLAASVGLLAVGPLQENFGWSSVWIYLIACTVGGIVFLSKKILSELNSTTNSVRADV